MSTAVAVLRSSRAVMHGQRALTILWLVMPLVAMAIPFVYYVSGTLASEDLLESVKSLSELFVPYTGMVLAYIYRVSSSRNSRHGSQSSRQAMTVSLVASVFWNLVVIAPLLRSVFVVEPFGPAIDMSRTLARVLSWVVAPALGYLFAADRSDRHPSA